jgi:PAS domain S-box-containing protein
MLSSITPSSRPTVGALIAGISGGPVSAVRGFGTRPLQKPDFMALAMEQIPLALWVVGNDGRCIFANAFAKTLLHPDGKGLEGRVLRAFSANEQPCDPADLPHVRALARGETVSRTKLRIDRQDGTRVAVLASAAPLRNREGQIEGAVALFEEVGAPVVAERFERDSGLETELLGMISHDLRDPLQTIVLSSGTLLRRSVPIDDAAKRGLRRIYDAAGRATRMIRDLLDCTQLRLGGRLSLRLASVDLDLVVSEALEEVSSRFSHRPVVRQRGSDLRGLWDGDRLAQVTVNLLSNALKYSPDGSTLRITTGGDDRSVFLEIHNSGEPIAPEQLSDIFRPMQRAGKIPGHPHGGLGLGLYIVDQLVRAHHGEVTVKSTAQGGTAFTVRLPRRPADD